MRNVKYLLFILFLVMFPLSVNAECDYQRMAELNKIASNVQLSYSYEIDDRVYPAFFVSISNITDDIYISFDPSGANRKLIYENSENIPIYHAGSNEFYIYSRDVNCNAELLQVKYITIPSFNSFSQYKECQNNPNFKYCKLWGNFDLTDSEFYEKYSSYVTKKNNDISPVDRDRDLQKNGLVIVLIVVLLIISLIYIIKKKTIGRNY